MPTNFETLCKKYFLPSIVKYGFLKDSAVSDVWADAVKYKNSTTGLEVSFEEREYNRLFIMIYRLTEAEFPKHSTVSDFDANPNRFDLDDLMALRGCDFEYSAELRQRKALPKVLTVFGAFLCHQAKDVLTGNFSILPEIQKIIEARAKNIPKQN